MRRLWRALGQIGVDERVPPFEAKHIVLANQVAFLVVTLDALALSAHAWGPWLARLLLASMLGHTLTPLLNSHRSYFAARCWMGFWSIATTVALAALLPRAADTSLILLTIAVGAWLIAPRRERWWAAGTNLLCFGSFVWLEWWYTQHEATGFEPTFTRELSWSSHFWVFFMLVGIGIHVALNAGRAEDLVEAERDKSERLLLNVLPKRIADRLRENPGTIADRLDHATVLFADIAGFTRLAERTTAAELVRRLDEIFSAFDALAEKHGLEKIKTVGDAYMVAGGVPEPRADHARAVVSMALEMLAAVAAISGEESLALRIGVAKPDRWSPESSDERSFATTCGETP
jgi:hypothetical protein